MKTLKNHVLLFDQNCPFCRSYTGAFVKTGMLDPNGRQAYGHPLQTNYSELDNDRARNEIALVNTKTGEVAYGIDSLFRIIATAFPVFSPLFRLSAFRWLMKQLYAFISYNRKVIIPSAPGADLCQPDVNLTWRSAWILFTWLITSMILSSYSHHLEGLLPPSRFFREFLICGGQIIFQTCAVSLVARDKLLSYLGNMMTISFAGSLLLLIIDQILQMLVINDPRIYAGFFLLTAGCMFLEHLRRMRLLGIHWTASLSWAVYRILVLVFIL